MADQKPGSKWTKELIDFHQRLDEVNLGPLWASVFSTPQPESTAIPYMWKKELILEYLEESKHLLQVGTGSIDRRALYLINPGMKDMKPHGWGGATQTLYAAVQAINPGEIARAHRHTTSAARFIMEGHGASGIVNGVKYKFEPGDYLITPEWVYHDHINESDETVLWMDFLDIPFVKALSATFFEFHSETQQPIIAPDDYTTKLYQGGVVRPLHDRKPSIAPLGRYKWDLTKASIDGMSEFSPDVYDGYAVEYVNPSNGKDANGRMGARMQKLPPRFKGKAHRHVHSCVYYVHKGMGYTVINGMRFDWKAGDIIALPIWALHEHVNTSDTEEAYLFSINDLPIMEVLNLEREDYYDQNEGYQAIEAVFDPLLP